MDLDLDLKAARDGLLSVEALILRLVEQLRASEAQAQRLERELIETTGQRDALKELVHRAQCALGLGLPRAMPASEGSGDRPPFAGVSGAALSGSLTFETKTTGTARSSAPSGPGVALPVVLLVTCVVCGTPFERRIGSGRPTVCCSDACKDRHRRSGINAAATTRRAAQKPSVQDQMTAAVAAGAIDPDPRRVESAVDRYRKEQERVLAPPPKPSERRCGRCCNKFQPADHADYYCASCRAKGAGAKDRAYVRNVPCDSDLEVAWNGTGPLPGHEAVELGSSLAPSTALMSAGGTRNLTRG